MDDPEGGVVTVSTERRRDYTLVGLWIALVVSCVVWALPFVFIVLTSLKSTGEISGGSAWAPPEQWRWDNYPDAADRGDLVTSFGNSLLIACIKVPLGLLVSAAAAFALARLALRWQRAVLLVVTVGAMVPIQVALAPLFTTMSALDLLNSDLGIILPYLAFGIPYQVFFLHGFFRAIPMELDEAARIDGASNARLFFRIILPLAKPALAALFILDFVATWNEYSIALTLLQDQDTWTVPLALQGFSSQFTSSYGQLNAFIVMSILPVLVVYLLFQRYFTQGALAGAVKG
ncbi:carbohydrate ABC transporter permease [Pseudonocardia sp. DSM 110487]|uniref:carbohydrate ABC transporter permease n=1 Tax=Pseudonocardia sp. DSM 110487 TaxID=2865833 RepID=UPI001C697592|nr:carbohydrate ABC transporter permease [Pseudonocardia sp. DSM 110487]QYN38789.1 carbohydrate ABC transporter permease [Pseudonocardia sp. DSM 110487]